MNSKKRIERFPILTIGHSTHTAERFCELLAVRAVDTVLDVRSSPYSRRAPQFNRHAMADWLSAAGIRYVFAGKSLGGRPNDPSLYDHGRADYALMAQTEEFIGALRRLASWSRSTRCILVCAEADPLECHRFLLIGRALAARDFTVAHVLPNGRTETHSEAERRLIGAVGLAQPEFFASLSDVIGEAYNIQERRFAFRINSGPEEESWLSQGL